MLNVLLNGEVMCLAPADANAAPKSPMSDPPKGYSLKNGQGYDIPIRCTWDNNAADLRQSSPPNYVYICMGLTWYWFPRDVVPPSGSVVWR